VRRTSNHALLQQFSVGLISLFCCAQGFGAFVESDGLVVMEAEHYQSTTPASAHSWIPTNSPTGFVGASAMLAAPNTGVNIGGDITNTSPGLTYAIQFTGAGTYKFWIRGWAAGGSDDSVYMGVDGQVVRALAYGKAGAWTWMGVPVSITRSGLHEINLWMREDGAYVDRLLMTTNMTFVPSGNGPPESVPAPPPNAPPVVQITAPAPGSTIPSGMVPVDVDVSDSNDTVAMVKLYVNGALTGSDGNVPFGFSWSPAPGSYDLVAVATDSLGAAATSAPVNVTITSPPSFAVQITSPPHGASFPAGTMLQVSADATDLDGAVTGVNFYANGALTASDGKAPFRFDWAPAPGTYQLFASATDTTGQTSSSPAIRFVITPSASVRYARSSETIYVEGGGAATLSAIQAALPDAPLFLTDPANRIWYLAAHIVVADGSTLMLYGGARGGDVNELRLKSNNSSVTNNFVTIDADRGTLDLRSVKVTSWDDQTGGPDTEYAVFKRAFIRARSRLVGTVAQESRLNVIDSEISYLGCKLDEGYGLTWDAASTAAGVKVFGEVSGSSIHDCQLGVSTWVTGDVSWSGNTIASNTLYGFEAGDPACKAVLADNDVHDNDYGATFRWASASHRIYVTGPGSATLSDIKAALPGAPLARVNSPGQASTALPPKSIWYLGANLFVENGAQLKLYGPAIGGDVDELRLQSDNSPVTNSYVELRADWGWLDIRNIKITSWDSAAGGPDTEYETKGRAFIRVRSSLAADGVTPLESRMDIVDSDISYLGYEAAESYGLSWKVIGVHPDPAKSIFDSVKVRGDIRNSHIHHNYFGVYTFGAYESKWLNNEVDHNAGYGIDPHDDSDSLLIEGNDVHHNGIGHLRNKQGNARGLHGIIASRRCDHLVIRNNRSWANAGNGIMLHRHCDDSLVENNETFLNGDSGVAIFDSDRSVVQSNLILSNYNAGVRVSQGSSDNLIANNEVAFSGTNGFYFYLGTNAPEPDPVDPSLSSRTRRNKIANNFVHDCGSDGLKLSDSDDSLVMGNIFLANGPLLRFINCANSLFVSNTIPSDALVKVAGSPAANNVVSFKDQPRLTVQLDPFSTATFADDRGVVFDFVQIDFPTFADAEGSLVSVTAAQIGLGANTVVTRNFFVAPNSGAVMVNPTIWEQSGNFNKAWTAQASSGSAQITYAVGDLQPGVSYRVRRGSSQLTTLKANAQGYITFSTVPGTTAALSYSVRRH
jgi:parallel beta-helix repeat protein